MANCEEPLEQSDAAEFRSFVGGLELAAIVVVVLAAVANSHG